MSPDKIHITVEVDDIRKEYAREKILEHLKKLSFVEKAESYFNIFSKVKKRNFRTERIYGKRIKEVINRKGK